MNIENLSRLSTLMGHPESFLDSIVTRTGQTLKRVANVDVHYTHHCIFVYFVTQVENLTHNSALAVMFVVLSHFVDDELYTTDVFPLTKGCSNATFNDMCLRAAFAFSSMIFDVLDVTKKEWNDRLRRLFPEKRFKKLSSVVYNEHHNPE